MGRTVSSHLPYSEDGDEIPDPSAWKVDSITVTAKANTHKQQVYKQPPHTSLCPFPETVHWGFIHFPSLLKERPLALCINVRTSWSCSVNHKGKTDSR